jgi:hypothetical protein
VCSLSIEILNSQPYKYTHLQLAVAWSAFSSSDPTVLNGKKFQDILRNPKERAKYNLIDIRSPEEMKLLYIDGQYTEIFQRYVHDVVPAE